MFFIFPDILLLSMLIFNRYWPNPRKCSLLLSSYFFWSVLLCDNVATKEKNKMIAGISWRRTRIAPITTKIQKAIPVSLKLMARANAGVAIKVVNPIINPANLCFFSLSTVRSPFINGFTNAFHVQTWNQESKLYNLYQKNIFLSIFYRDPLSF